MSDPSTYVSIASLPEINGDSHNETLSRLAIEHYNGDGNGYASHSITVNSLVSVLFFNGFSNVFDHAYGLQAGTTNFGSAEQYYRLLSQHLQSDGTFKTQPYYDRSKLINENNLNAALSGSKNYVSLSSNASFYTTYHNLENSSNAYIDISNINQAPATDSDKHNRYIFKVSRHTSNEYTCGQSGWFSCYGWLSEKETYVAESDGSSGKGRQDNSKRWAVLEGKFGGEWKILQLQAVLPGNYCSYVGFSLPVRKNLVLRVSTGFDVGSNSGKWSNVAGSLTNHIPNAFIGGIYA